MQKLITSAIVTIVFLNLLGCATNGSLLVDQGKIDINSAKLCCNASLSQAKVLPLPSLSAHISLDKTKQVFDFGGNKSFFVLYKLPEFKDSYSIKVISAAQGTVEDVAIFLPRLALFDESFKPTRYFDEKVLRSRGTNVETTVFINPSNSSEQYLAIYASDLNGQVEMAYSEVRMTPIFAGPFVFYMPTGKDGKSVRRSSPVGEVQIEIQGLSK
jgi:Maltose operon periplasmic protein precursor (MalM)